MEKVVIYPAYLSKHGITRNTRGFEGSWNLAAADVETVEGNPYIFQFCWNGTDVDCIECNENNILSLFLQRVEMWARRGTVNCVWFHNLKFDLQALFYRKDHRDNFGEEKRDFVVDHEGCRIHAYTDKTWFARIKLSSRRSVWICDTAAFFKSTLKKAAEMVGSPYQKLDRPPGLGDYNLRDRSVFPLGRPDFEEYIRNDALAQYYVARAIYKMHEEHDVRLSVSIPAHGARILRHRFFREGDSMPFPKPIRVAHAAEASYHGGKNQQSVKPGFYDNVWEIDINSAYTSAMVNLPSFVKGKYEMVKAYVPGAIGVYQVSGSTNCPYGLIFDHSFNRVNGSFSDLWVTSFEIAAGLKCGCLKLKKCKGYIWVPECDYSPLRAYAQHFWKEKSERAKTMGKGSLGYNSSKLLVNAIYGKLISNIKDPDLCEMLVDEKGNSRFEEVYRASGMYHPFLATCITGYVRGHLLHSMEHEFKAMHTSTDSIKTQVDPHGHPNVGPELGQWSIEIFGRCMLLRPKLYVHESYDETYIDKGTGEEKHKMKYAKHGFMGRLDELLKASDYRNDGQDSPILHGQKYKYFYQHVWSVRESMIRKKKACIPLNFERIPRDLQPVA